MLKRALGIAAAGVLLTLVLSVSLQAGEVPASAKPTTEPSVKQDTSPKLRDLAPKPPRKGLPREVPLRRIPPPKDREKGRSGELDGHAK
jgi:hypothetical protein